MANRRQEVADRSLLAIRMAELGTKSPVFPTPHTLGEELDFLRRDRACGCLTVQSAEGKTCRVYLLFGQPIDAESSAETGDAALKEARQWSSATWVFDARSFLPNRITISGAEAAVKTASENALRQVTEPRSQSGVSRVEPLVLRMATIRRVYLSVVAGTLALGALLFPLYFDSPVGLSLFPAALAGYVFLVARRWRLVLDENGFTFCGVIRRRTVPWVDVKSFGTERRGALTRVVTFNYRPEFYALFASRGVPGFVRLIRLQISAYIPPLGTDIDAQLMTMEAWRRAYGLSASSESAA